MERTHPDERIKTQIPRVTQLTADGGPLFQWGARTLNCFERGLEVLERLEEAHHFAIPYVSIRGYKGSRGGRHTFPTSCEMGLECVPSDRRVLTACLVDEIPRVVAGKVLECAVRLDVVRKPKHTCDPHEHDELPSPSGERYAVPTLSLPSVVPHTLSECETTGCMTTWLVTSTTVDILMFLISSFFEILCAR